MFTKEKINKVIERNDEEEVHVSLELGAGKLQVTGGTDRIMEGTFTCKGKVIDAEMEYEITKERVGELTISQCSTNMWNLLSIKQDWKLILNDSLPLSLKLELGAGKSDLNLSELNLKNVDIEAGVGETLIDLSGDWQESFKVNVDSGVGKTRMILPKHVGVKLDVDRGVGRVNADYFMRVGDSYQNQAYENATVTIEIDIDVGVGEVTIEQK